VLRGGLRKDYRFFFPHGFAGTAKTTDFVSRETPLTTQVALFDELMLGFCDATSPRSAMTTSRPLIYVLLCAGTVVNADPRADLPSISFSHKDWEIACDNTRTCRAAGYHPDDDAPNASVLLSRAAGPGQPVTVQLQLADDERRPTPERVAMSIDGRAMGSIRIDVKSSIGTLSDEQAKALLPALLNDSRIAWSANGTAWTVSTAGANAVLLKMDEFQGRLDTPGALVRKGSKPESIVLPPLAPPEIKAGAVNPDRKPVKLTTAQTRDLVAALRTTIKDGSCDLVDVKTDDAGEVEVRRLTKDKLLVSHACWMAAYNSGDGYWVTNALPPYAPVLVTTSATNYDNGVNSSTQKGRGIGDCFSLATWTWDGRTFVQTSATTTGMCRQIAAGGAWNLPTLVTRVRQ
jgi:hypothetical protein